MKNFLFIIQLVSSLFPILTQAVRSVEDALPGTGNGPAKLALVRSFLENAYQQMTDVQVTFEQLWPTIQSAITALVAFYNASGIFKKTP